MRSEVFDELARELSEAKRRGWRDAEIQRVVRKRLSARHARLVVARTVASAEEADALAVLLVVRLLPPLPTLRSARTGPGVDGRMLERVRALLAKAESTNFPEEAEALSAKAQELMARYAIDRAMVESAASGGRRRSGGGSSGRRIGIDDPYAGAKSLLLSVVANANRCRAVWSGGLGLATVFGADDDLDIVELLFTSLLCQATSAMAAARSTSKSFRYSFLVAYATRIGARLREATEAATEEAVHEHGGERLLPVLTARSVAAEEAVREAFGGDVRRRSVVARDAAGWAAGTAAASLASLRVGPEVEQTAS